LFPYTTLFRSAHADARSHSGEARGRLRRRLLRVDAAHGGAAAQRPLRRARRRAPGGGGGGHGEAGAARAREADRGPRRAPAQVGAATRAAYALMEDDDRDPAFRDRGPSGRQPELAARGDDTGDAALGGCRRERGRQNRTCRRRVPGQLPVVRRADTGRRVLPQGVTRRRDWAPEQVWLKRAAVK